jgi:glycopeptide antibiotics resistance protein
MVLISGEVIPPGLILIILIIVLWEAVWKLIAMWKAAQNKSVAWFIALAIFNTIGILPILYIYVFSRKKKSAKKAIKRKKR